MAAEPLDEVLRLVAEGRLTAEEAAPILAALDDAGGGQGTQMPDQGRARTDELPGGFGASAPPGFGDDLADGFPGGAAPTSLRIEVTDGGRQVVNIRLPIAVGRFALDRVPGLSREQVDRVREAMHSGFRGPVLVVDDGDNGVRIILE